MRAKELKINKILKPIFDEFIYGGHLLSLGASGIVLTVMVLLNEKISISLLVIAYLIAQIVYTLNHYKELKIDIMTNPERAKYLAKGEKYFPLLISVYSVLLLTILILFSNLNTLVFIFILGALGFFYLKNLTKNIIGFKNYYVAFLWATASVVLPYLYFSIKVDKFFYFIFIFVFIRWLVNTTFFDLKDIKGDKDEGLKTIPVVIGVKNTLLLLSFYNILSGAILIYAIYFGVISIAASGLLLLIPYSFYYLFISYNANPAKIRKVSYIMVDGEYVFWPILILLGGLIIR
jgi:4-hydroxybenzoate polyprenyltransferase